MNMKETYHIEHRVSREKATVIAESFQEACEAKGWLPGDCYLVRKGA